MKIITSAIDGSGKTINIGAELGRGGEGSVFEVRGQSNLVAKIYHNPIDSAKEQKILSMVDLKTDQLLLIATWPLDVLKSSSNGSLVGFLMPKLSGKEIHKLYGPKTRLLEFPNATFPFLVHTATNLARSFAAMHESGHFIGDVNHGNFYVSDNGTVMLVDCDSFQITTTKARFRCEVGVPMYQPPEFQDISSFRDVVRTANHDNFGLAVFIFLLLFMGRHPFSGRYLGPGDMPIEKAIKEFRFAYSSTASKKMMQQPPGTIALNILPNSIVDLFERAFSAEGVKEGKRPNAKEWIQSLESLPNLMKKCTRNEGHNYLNALTACPWCEVEAKTGVVLFHATISLNMQRAVGSFILEAIWAQVKGVPSPGLPPSLPNSSSYTMQPSSRVLENIGIQKKRIVLTAIPILLALILIFAFPEAFFWIALVTIFVSGVVYNTADKNKAIKSELKKEHDITLQRWKAISDRWLKEAGNEAFTSKMNELEKARTDYMDLFNQRKSKLNQLEAQQRNRQLHAHLQRYRLESAQITGIGPSRKATLRSFGIETAADITTNAIRQVPGFGPSYSRKLMDWRNSIEKSFRFDQNKGVPQSDILALDREIASKRIKLEKELQDGPTQLMQIANQIKVRRNTLWSQIEENAKALAQIEIDLKAI